MAIVKVINKSKNNLPQYETIGSAGMDVRADIAENMELAPMQVRPRSGLAIKKGITLVNSPGTIDSDYRGEIKVIVINLSTESQIVEPAERIAQLVVDKYEKVEWESSEALAESDRGAGGFGSTGKN